MKRNLTLTERTFFLSEFKKYILKNGWVKFDELIYQKKYEFNHEGKPIEIHLIITLNARKWNLIVVCNKHIIMNQSGFYKELIISIQPGYSYMEFFLPVLISKKKALNTVNLKFKRTTNTTRNGLIANLPS
jgi:hypothetical protein